MPGSDTPDAGPATPGRGRDGRRQATADRRRAREQEILDATRSLFDKRGVRDAQIEDIAAAAGINRAIIYRHFTGKEELFALTLVGYLGELAERLEAARQGDPPDQLRGLITAFCEFGLEFPAFADCAQSLMRRTGPELLEEISEAALLRLGQAMSGCLGTLRRTLEEGQTSGDFDVQDTVLLANSMYATALGGLQLARVGILVEEESPGVPRIGRVAPEQVRDYLIRSAFGAVRIH